MKHETPMPVFLMHTLMHAVRSCMHVLAAMPAMRLYQLM